MARDDDSGPIRAFADPARTSDVTAAMLTRRQGYWFQRAVQSPVFISHHNRPSHVLVTREWFDAHSPGAQGAHDDAALEAVIRDVTFRTDQGFFWLDIGLAIRVLNPVAALHFGLTEARAVGRTFAELMPQLLSTLIYGKIVRSLNTGELHCADVPSVVRPDHWIHFETFPFAGGVACWFRCITDEVRANRLADVNRALVDTMTVHGGIGFAQLSPRGSIVRAGKALGDIMQLGEDRLRGVLLVDLVVREDKPAVRDAIEALFVSGEPACLGAALLSNDGVAVRVRMALSELRGCYGSEGAVVLVTRGD